MYIYDNISQRNVVKNSCKGNQNTFYFQELFFPENPAICEIMWKKYGIDGRATDENMANVHCMLDT